MYDSQIRLHNICKELGEIYKSHGQSFVFGFHFQLHNEQGQLIDAFSLSNINQTTLVQYYMKSVTDTIHIMSHKKDGCDFNIGTKVVCIDDTNYNIQHTDPIPPFGKVLTVKACFRGLIAPDVYLQFEEMETVNPFYGYHANRFISYESWINRRIKFQ